MGDPWVRRLLDLWSHRLLDLWSRRPRGRKSRCPWLPLRRRHPVLLPRYLLPDLPRPLRAHPTLPMPFLPQSGFVLLRSGVARRRVRTPALCVRSPLFPRHGRTRTLLFNNILSPWPRLPPLLLLLRHLTLGRMIRGRGSRSRFGGSCRAPRVVLFSCEMFVRLGMYVLCTRVGIRIKRVVLN